VLLAKLENSLCLTSSFELQTKHRLSPHPTRPRVFPASSQNLLTPIPTPTPVSPAPPLQSLRLDASDRRLLHWGPHPERAGGAHHRPGVQGPHEQAGAAAGGAAAGHPRARHLQQWVLAARPQQGKGTVGLGRAGAGGLGQSWVRAACHTSGRGGPPRRALRRGPLMRAEGKRRLAGACCRGAPQAGAAMHVSVCVDMDISTHAVAMLTCRLALFGLQPTFLAARQLTATCGVCSG
jgi:hypothetical protein